MSIQKFSNYLVSKQFILQNQLPFYIKWVEVFLQFCKDQADPSRPADLVDPFLNWLSARRKAWKVEQAKEAVSLYLFFVDKVHRRHDGKPV